MGRSVAVNDRGLRIGEDHPQATLTDGEIELIRQLHEDGMSYPVLAEKFDVSKWCVAKICRYERRAQTPVEFKVVPVPDGK